eukprot:5094711-Pleurochrysis_carterae.AAC.1
MRCPLPGRHRWPIGGGRGPREGRYAFCFSCSGAKRRLCALADSGNADRHTVPKAGCPSRVQAQL